MKIGLIGTGYWGKILIKNLSTFNDVELAWISDLEITDNLKSLRNFASYKVGLEYEVDLVIVSTPAHTHYEIVKNVLLSGNNFLVTKPITKNINELDELIDIANKKNVKIYADYTFTYSSAIKQIKVLLDKKAIGYVLGFTSVRANLGKIQSDVSVVEDLMVHDISIIDFLFQSELKQVFAVGSHELGSNHFSSVSSLLEYANGLKANIFCSWISPWKQRGIKIYGSKGAIYWDETSPTPLTLSEFSYNKNLNIFEQNVVKEKIIEIGPKSALIYEFEEIFKDIMDMAPKDYTDIRRITVATETIVKKIYSRNEGNELN